MASQITGVSLVCSAVCSGADQRKHKSFASLVFVGESTGHRWISLTRRQLRGKWFHLMTSSWNWRTLGWRQIRRYFLEFKAYYFDSNYFKVYFLVIAWRLTGDTPLLEPLTTNIYVAIWRHWATIWFLFTESFNIVLALSHLCIMLFFAALVWCNTNLVLRYEYYLT